MTLDVATTLDTYEWPIGGDFRWRWGLETSDDPKATTGAPEDVSDVSAVRMWLQLRVARGVTPPAPAAYTNAGGQCVIDASGSPAWLCVALSQATDGASVPAGTYDALISFDRAGGVIDDVARFVLVRAQGPRPAS